ncbi:MAG: DUF5050 domain-containing protein [Oscillospiraceae bacterium]|nr:DUF5050 domain-containing protein [Oscillospiraceae bacterium]
MKKYICLLAAVAITIPIILSCDRSEVGFEMPQTSGGGRGLPSFDLPDISESVSESASQATAAQSPSRTESAPDQQGGSRDSDRRGNNSGNLANGGYMAEKNGLIHYRGPVNGGLHRMRAIGAANTQITNETAKSINVLDNWVYYIADDGILVKMRINGSNKQDLATGVTSINVIDNHIYFTADALYRMNTDGTDRVTLHGSPIPVSVIDNGWIYYWGDGGINRIRTDGTGLSRIVDMAVNGSINAAGGRVYYSDGENLVAAGADGTGRQVLADKNPLVINAADDGWIYYYELAGVFRVRPDGTNPTRLTNANYANNPAVKSLSIAGDWVYFYDNSEIYYVRKNGTGSGTLR